MSWVVRETRSVRSTLKPPPGAIVVPSTIEALTPGGTPSMLRLAVAAKEKSRSRRKERSAGAHGGRCRVLVSLARSS